MLVSLVPNTSSPKFSYVLQSYVIQVFSFHVPMFYIIPLFFLHVFRTEPQGLNWTFLFFFRPTRFPVGTLAQSPVIPHTSCSCTSLPPLGYPILSSALLSSAVASLYQRRPVPTLHLRRPAQKSYTSALLHLRAPPCPPRLCQASPRTGAVEWYRRAGSIGRCGATRSVNWPTEQRPVAAARMQRPRRGNDSRDLLLFLPKDPLYSHRTVIVVVSGWGI